MKKIIPPPPPPPLSRLVKEGTFGDCPYCHSTTIKRFGLFGSSIGCINPKCKNYRTK
jgi:ssDNA-binding Zn-finger/Zn-ribbon topoisomerase 1